MKTKAFIIGVLALLTTGVVLKAGGNGECRWEEDNAIYICTGGAGYCGVQDIKCTGIKTKLMDLSPNNPWL